MIIALILLSIEFVKYFGIFPSHRLAQIYWHMTNESTIENENIKLKLPIKWILGEETSNQYLLIGDYRENGILKSVVFTKKPMKKETIVSGMANKDNCLLKNQIYEKIILNDNIFELYGCSVNKEYSSIAMISDINYTFNMIMYDYKMSDKEDIIELLNALRIK